VSHDELMAFRVGEVCITIYGDLEVFVLIGRYYFERRGEEGRLCSWP